MAWPGSSTKPGSWGPFHSRSNRLKYPDGSERTLSIPALAFPREVVMRNSRGSRVRLSMDWVDAAADLAGNSVAMLRRLSEAVGTLTGVALVAPVTMPGVRESMVQAARDWFASESSAESDAVAEASPSAAAHDGLTVSVRWVNLNPNEASVAQYLSRRYHVADGAVRPLVLAARGAGREAGLVPLLL